MQVWIEDNKAIIRCSYHEKELVKAIGDYKFDKATVTWRFPIRKLIDIIDNLKIEYSEETALIYNKLREDRQAYHSKINQADKIKTASGTDIIDLSKKIDFSMCYEHQRKAIQLASLFNSYALFLEPGCGKTLIAIKLIESWKVPALIIAPLSTLESVWMEEIKKWNPLKSTVKSNEMSKLTVVNLWHNLKEFENNYDIFLINFEGFKKLIKTSKVPIEAKIGCMVVDECSKMKNHRSQITKAILQYKHSILHKLALSGSPSPNSLLEYWGPMEFINDELLG